MVTDRDIPVAAGDDVAVAPGPLHLVQAFATTRGDESGTDLLGTREGATAWLHTTGLLPTAARLSNSEHGALLRLRESIRDVLAAHAGAREDAEAAARLTKALADGRVVVTVDPVSAVQLVSAARASYSSIVAALAVAIAEAAASGAWPRLKRCGAPRCGQVFYDGSVSAACQRCPAHRPAGGKEHPAVS